MAVQYVGPYTGTAYDAANQAGSEGVPLVYPTGTVDAANAILAAQPSGSTTTTATAPLIDPKIANDQAAISNTQKSLDQLPGILANALQQYQNGYDSAEGGLNQSEQAQRSQYDTGTTTNQQNYDANLMASLRAGATGLGGLLSILRGTGAEGWANQAVGDTTNSDIRTGLNTRNENQTSLDTSLSGFLTDLADKHRQNQETLTGNQYAARGNNATQLQDLYTKLAGFYNDMGDTGNATNYLNQAGNQAPAIAQYGTAPVSSDFASTVPVRAAPVTAFSGATQQAVTAPDATPGSGNGIFTIGDTRKRLAGVGA